MGHSIQAVLSNLPVDGQIHARHPKGLAERDLLSPCGRFFLHAVMRFLLGSGTEDDVFLVGDACDELEGGNRSRARKWYRGNQNLEVKTESWLLTLGDRGIELQYLKLSPAARVHRLICTGSSCELTMTRIES